MPKLRYKKPILFISLDLFLKYKNNSNKLVLKLVFYSF